MAIISWCCCGREYYMNFTFYLYSHKVSGDPKDTADEGHVLPWQINYVKSVFHVLWIYLAKACMPYQVYPWFVSVYSFANSPEMW